MIKADGAIFDLDGTLWDSAIGVCRSWNEVMERFGMERSITIEEMHSQMGKPMHEIFLSLFPGLTPEQVDELEKSCCAHECDCLSRCGGTLYPKLEETLKELSERMPLFIVSNCQSGYIEAFFAAHGLKKYFRDHECSGRTGLSKAENIRLIVERNALSSPVYVGDTALDGISAREAGVAFIHAAYGFGKTDDKDAALNSFAELTNII